MKTTTKILTDQLIAQLHEDLTSEIKLHEAEIAKCQFKLGILNGLSTGTMSSSHISTSAIKTPTTKKSGPGSRLEKRFNNHKFVKGSDAELANQLLLDRKSLTLYQFCKEFFNQLSKAGQGKSLHLLIGKLKSAAGVDFSNNRQSLSHLLVEWKLYKVRRYRRHDAKKRIASLKKTHVPRKLSTIPRKITSIVPSAPAKAAKPKRGDKINAIRASVHKLGTPNLRSFLRIQRNEKNKSLGDIAKKLSKASGQEVGSDYVVWLLKSEGLFPSKKKIA